MNASDPNGNFGLWYVASAGGAHPGAPRRVTDRQRRPGCDVGCRLVEPLTARQPAGWVRS